MKLQAFVYAPIVQSKNRSQAWAKCLYHELTTSYSLFSVICITIQRTLSAAEVRYLIGDKECFKIFYPRFFAWVNLFLLNYILLYSLLFPFQSIQTYVARVPVLNGLFRLHILILSCVLYKIRSSIFIAQLKTT